MIQISRLKGVLRELEQAVVMNQEGEEIESTIGEHEACKNYLQACIAINIIFCSDKPYRTVHYYSFITECYDFFSVIKQKI